jgi:cytochrome c2
MLASTSAAAQDHRESAEVFKKCRACHQVGEGAKNVVALGLQPTGTSSAELAKFQKANLDLWGLVIKASGFKPN